MTVPDTTELVERLRARRPRVQHGQVVHANAPAIQLEAADRIDALEAETLRLRQALAAADEALDDVTRALPQEEFDRLYGTTQEALVAAYARARQALSNSTEPAD